MSSVPEGRAANQPLGRAHLDAADGRVVSRCCSEHLFDPLAGELRAAHLRAVELAELLLLLRGRGSFDAICKRLAQFARERAVGLTGIAAAARGDLGRQQRGRDAVLVGAPSAAVEPQERGAGAFLSAESQIAREKPLDKPFEPDRAPRTSAASSRAATRSIMALLTMVLPTPAPGFHSGRLLKQVIDRPPTNSDWAASNRCSRSRCRAGHGRCRRRTRCRTCPSGR